MCVRVVGVLKEVEVASLLVFDVVGLGLGVVLGTGEQATLGEMRVDIQLALGGGETVVAHLTG